MGPTAARQAMWFFPFRRSNRDFHTVKLKPALYGFLQDLRSGGAERGLAAGQQNRASHEERDFPRSPYIVSQTEPGVWLTM